MRVQTDRLVQSMPCCAELFVQLDTAAAEWKVVQWSEKSPVEVVAGDMVVLKKLMDMALDSPKEVVNSFPSRTAALRASERSLRAIRESRSEKGHWGVWEFLAGKGGKVRCYRSVVGVPKLVAVEGPVAESVVVSGEALKAAIESVVESGESPAVGE